MSQQNRNTQNWVIAAILIALGVAFALIFMGEQTAAVGTWLIFFTLLAIPLVMLLRTRNMRNDSDRDNR